MKPEEFIRFAEDLSRTSRSSAAACRSIISRAYYGAFLKVREDLLRRMGFRIRVGGNEHIWLRRLLLESKIDAAETIAQKLKVLNNARNDADYDVRQMKSEQQVTVLNCLKLAQDVEKIASECVEPATFARIQSGITAYLKKINEL